MAGSLADAGIVVYDLVAACSISRINDHLLLDPNKDEEKQQSGIKSIYLPKWEKHVIKLNGST